MANLLVEMGNTALKAAWSEGNILGKTFRYQGEKMVEFLLSIMKKEVPEVLTVSSVSVISQEDADALSMRCGELIILDAAHPEFLSESGLPEYLSYDRAASLIAARYLFPGKECTVFDFGTTINIDFIDAEGKYLGGNISPGVRTRFKSLNRYSRSLPLVNSPEEAPEVGLGLVSSIEAGVLSGIKFEVEGYFASRPGNVVLFTGGDANYLAKMTKNSIFVVCNLVLMGLLQLTNSYVRKKIS